MNAKKYCLILCLLITLTGCSDLQPANTVQTKPNRRDLVGAYHLSERSQIYIGATGQYQERETSVSLSQDGTCIIQNMPDVVHTSDYEPHGEFYSSRAKWTLQKTDDGWVVRVTPGKFAWDDLMISSSSDWKNQPPYELEFMIGDADNDKGLYFEKTTK